MAQQNCFDQHKKIEAIIKSCESFGQLEMVRGIIIRFSRTQQNKGNTETSPFLTKSLLNIYKDRKLELKTIVNGTKKYEGWWSPVNKGLSSAKKIS